MVWTDLLYILCLFYCFLTLLLFRGVIMQKGFQFFLGPPIRGPKKSKEMETVVFKLKIIHFGEDIQHTWQREKSTKSSWGGFLAGSQRLHDWWCPFNRFFDSYCWWKKIRRSPLEVGSWNPIVLTVSYIQTVVGLGISESTSIYTYTAFFWRFFCW